MSHRGWRTRIILTLLVVLTLVSSAATGLLAFVGLQLGRVERVEVADSLTSAPQQPVTAVDVLMDQSASGLVTVNGSPDAADASGTNAAGGGSAMGDAGGASQGDGQTDQPAEGSVLPSSAPGENYLLVGTDSALGLDADDPLREGHWDTSQLADVIMVIRLRDDGTAAMVSIPRDLSVEIAGISESDGTSVFAKINSAYNRDRSPADRAARLINTIEENFDITLQHFVEADFEAFLRVVDAVGGVEMSFDRPLRDQPKNPAVDPIASRSGFITEAGTHTLDGRQALAYVRSRRLQVQMPDGTWQQYGHWNDLARNDRQRDFLQIAAQQAAPALLASPLRLLSVLDIAADHLATSDTLSIINDGRRLANDFAGLDFDKDIEEYELRVRDSHDPVPWALALTTDPHNQRVLDVFNGIGWDDIVESRVEVVVTGDERHRVAAELRQIGFDAQAAGSVPRGIEHPPTTTVIYLAPDGRLSGGLLASHLVPVPDFAGHDDLDPTTVILHTGTEPLRIDSGYRTVDVPSAQILAQQLAQ